MGNRVVWAAPLSDATWNYSRVYRADTQTGTYTQIVQQALTVSAPDTTYFDESGGSNHWYKVSFYNSSSNTESSLTPAFQCKNTTTTYCSTSNVASLLQMRNSQNLSDFDGQTRPNIYDVIDLIQRKEDEIDQVTGHAWRTRYSLSNRGDDTSSPQYEFHSIHLYNKASAGVPVNLHHRSVKTLASASGDVLEIWNGSSYTDYIASKTEGRGKDYWIDGAKGVLYIQDYTRSTIEEAVRIKYRYGESSVPRQVEELCALMTAVDIAMSDDQSYLLPSGGDNVGLSGKISEWQKRIRTLTSRMTEWKTGSI